MSPQLVDRRSRSGSLAGVEISLASAFRSNARDVDAMIDARDVTHGGQGQACSLVVGRVVGGIIITGVVITDVVVAQVGRGRRVR